MLATLMLAAAVASPSPSPTPSPSPQRLLGLIRAQFRSHRPPPPYVQYTIIRKQNATNGYPDFANSYTKHVWVRNSDRAGLTRLVFRDEARGPLTFDRPAFNEARDPGPPTADVFEPAPLRPHPVEEAATPEPHYTPIPIIGGVRTLVEFDYTVTKVDLEGELLHLHVTPIRDIERNRIRDIWAEKKTYELKKLLVTDKLFVSGDRTYGAAFTISMGVLQGYPVVTDIHGVVGDGYNDDGQQVDMLFRDITFPASVPDWYFNPRTYAAHQNDAPS
ncbi:MAG: hypothetical protein NVS3B7_01350 [Candidatus Elarobacter sp.]